MTKNIKTTTLLNEVNIAFTIKPKSPLLVKESLGKNADSNNAVAWLVKGQDGEEKPYIPGSTLKGLFREKFTSIYYDYLELDEEKREKSAMYDNIFDGHQEEMEKLVNSGDIEREDVYNKSLLVEQLFGSKVLKGRVWASDALLEGSYEPLKFNDSKEKISGNARAITPIDRFTGGAVVPLNFEYTTNDFTFDMKIKNITKDELKYLLLIIRDSQNGEVRVGSSKTRGFGEIELLIDGLSFKDYKDQNLDFGMDEFGSIDQGTSMKIGSKYLVKNHLLKDDYKAINGSNGFVKHIMGASK